MVEEARDPLENDEGFEALVFGALTHATACLEGAREGPLLPFAMIIDEGERSVRHFASPGYEQTLDGALAFASQGEYEFWAVAWDGFIEVDDRRQEAVFVRAGGRGRARSGLFAWRYERRGDRDLQRIGDPLFLGDVDREEL